MAKLKLVQANEKVAEKVAFGYKQVKNAVVGGYKKDTKNLHPVYNVTCQEGYKMQRLIWNPYLPEGTFIPDGEPHVFGNCLYVGTRLRAGRGWSVLSVLLL